MDSRGRKLKNRVGVLYIITLFSMFLTFSTCLPSYAGVDGIPIFLAGPATLNNTPVSNGVVVLIKVGDDELTSYTVGTNTNFRHRYIQPFSSHFF